MCSVHQLSGGSLHSPFFIDGQSRCGGHMWLYSESSFGFKEQKLVWTSLNKENFLASWIQRRVNNHVVGKSGMELVISDFWTQELKCAISCLCLSYIYLHSLALESSFLPMTVTWLLPVAQCCLSHPILRDSLSGLKCKHLREETYVPAKIRYPSHSH